MIIFYFFLGQNILSLINLYYIKMKIMKKLSISKTIFLAIILLSQIKSDEITISLNDISTDTINDNYEINSKVLNINSNGIFIITGECNECQILINENLEITLTINSISIDNSNTGPFVISKKSKVNLILVGESTITDNESNEDSESFEGAAIKFKKSSSLSINGDGKLNVNGNIKNGIKGAKSSSLNINSGTLVISAVKNGLACDDKLTINDGTITITSQSDGIKSDPDSDDDKSEGTITVNGGKITINSQNDAIQAAYKLIINGGNFDITTFNGASSSGFDEDTMSAKGLKCSTNEHENVTNVIEITGGKFILNTRDDAIHSDYNITIKGGTFDISTGDDGVHAEKFLILGELNADDSLIDLKITQSYEGLEGAYIYIYSGKYNIIASDDGINAAGDTDESCSMGEGGNQDGQGGFPGGQESPKDAGQGFNGGNDSMNGMQSKCYIFYLNIYGGDIYVNCESDGLDANGNITISGGNVEIWGMEKGGDGDPIDLDGTLTITGGTILAGGSQGMEPVHKYVKTISQEFIYTTDSINANTEISIKNGDTNIRTFTIPKNINYLFYTSKDTNENYRLSEGTTYNRTDALNSVENDNNFRGMNNPNFNNKDSNTNSTSSSSSSFLSSLNILILLLLCLILKY